MTNLFPVLILLATFFSIGSNLSAQTRVEKIDSLLQIAHQRGFFNGNALVAESENIIYQNQKGFADGSRQEKLSADLRFGIGSISKGFDGTALMMLTERGKLSLDDRLSSFYPSLPTWAQEITIEHLLQYTSGLPAPDYNSVRTDSQTWNFLQNIAHLNFEPGTDYDYNNSNVFLRKRIVEKVSGQPYADFITEHVFAPCGMRTAVIDPTEETPLLARSFDNHFVEDDLDTSMSGWVYLTIQDLYRWTQCLYSGQLIDEHTLYKLFESHKPSSQSPLGRTVFESDELIFQYHHGQSDNFEASLYVNVKDQFTVLLLTNNRNSNVSDLTVAIDAILMGEPFEVPKKSIEMILRTEIWYNGFEQGMRFLDSIRKNKWDIYDFENEEKELVNTGEYMIERNRFKEGIKVLEFTVVRFPQSWRAYEILANAYLQKNDQKTALRHFKKAHELNPDNHRIEEAYRTLVQMK